MEHPTYMKYYLTLLFVIVSTSLAHCQYDWSQGELVLKNGTSLKGLIKLPTVSKDLIAINGKEKVKFKATKKAKTEKYDETQVKLIIFRPSDTETAYFEYVPISKKKYGIFKIITKGEATLYGKAVSTTSSTPMYMGGPMNVHPTQVLYSFNNFDEYYVKRENEEIASPLITVRISRSFKNRSIEYFADCPAIVSKLEEKEYRKEDIKDMVEDYNACK